MTAAPTLDVVAIGNAIVDVLAPSDDAFLAEHALTKGGMQLIDAATAESLYADMAAGKEISGGSAANTLAGLAALGKKCAFIGQVCDDQLGAVFAHDVRALGIRYDTPAVSGDVPTARCLILVTPQRPLANCNLRIALSRISRRGVPNICVRRRASMPINGPDLAKALAGGPAGEGRAGPGGTSPPLQAASDNEMVAARASRARVMRLSF